MEIQQTRTLGQWRRLYSLYRSAFPRSERKPMGVIRSMQKQGRCDVWYFTDNGKFVALAITIKDGKGKVLLDYLAVTKESRSKGYGSDILSTLFAQYSGQDVFGEIEIADETADNYQDRVRRKQFYLRNGMRAVGVYITLFGVEMELLTNGCDMTFEEYLDFYQKNVGEFAVKNITKLQ